MKSLCIGWVGTGVMGNAMCSHMIEAGHDLYIHNRTRSKTTNLLEKGAKWCDSPKAVAEQSRIIFTIVGYPRDVEQVILGPEGVLAGAAKGTSIVDMTTSSPELAVNIHDKALHLGVHALDAPVSGGDIGARDATLAIMVGGNRDVFDRLRPLLEILGKNVVHMGAPGRGQHTKMANQILVAGTMIGVVESLLYARRNGIDLDAVIDVIGQGAASSWAINHLGRRIAKHDYSPGFYIKHFLKDMGIALDECRRMNLSLPGLSLAHQFYLAATAQGEQDLGTQGLYKVLSRMNGMNG